MTRKKTYQVDHLYPKTNFFVGVGSIFNIFGNYCEFNYSNGPNEADYKAISSDWNAVGNDIRRSTNVVGEELIHEK